MNNFKEKWLGLEADEQLHISDVLWIALPIVASIIFVCIALSTY